MERIWIIITVIAWWWSRLIQIPLRYTRWFIFWFSFTLDGKDQDQKFIPYSPSEPTYAFKINEIETQATLQLLKQEIANIFAPGKGNPQKTTHNFTK